MGRQFALQSPLPTGPKGDLQGVLFAVDLFNQRKVDVALVVVTFERRDFTLHPDATQTDLQCIIDRGEIVGNPEGVVGFVSSHIVGVECIGVVGGAAHGHFWHEVVEPNLG